jgi:hypothetical protein
MAAGSPDIIGELPCPRRPFALGCDGLGEPTMQPRESVPLWVGLTFALMIVGTVMYLTGYFMIEDLLAFLK